MYACTRAYPVHACVGHIQQSDCATMDSSSRRSTKRGAGRRSEGIELGIEGKKVIFTVATGLYSGKD